MSSIILEEIDADDETVEKVVKGIQERFSDTEFRKKISNAGSGFLMIKLEKPIMNAIKIVDLQGTEEEVKEFAKKILARENVSVKKITIFRFPILGM